MRDAFPSSTGTGSPEAGTDRHGLPMQQKADWSEADAIARRVLAEHDGVARIDEFLAAGLTRHQIAAIFRRGVVNRPRNAWFVDPELPIPAKRAVRVGGVADCVTAAALWGLPVPHGAHLHLHVHVDEHDTRLRHNRDRRHIVHDGDDPEVVLHRRRLRDPATWRTSLVDTLLQLAWCVPTEWFVAALDAALHRPLDGSREPLLSEEDYRRLADLLPHRFRAALDLLDPAAESPIESVLRVRLALRGIRPMVSQYWPTPRYRVDLLVLGALIIEADGEAWHDPEQDAIRDAFLRSLGYRVLRFSYDEIVFHMDEVLRLVEAELADMGLLVS